jgi:hypothetical protein
MRHTTHVFLVSGVPVRFAEQGTESVAVSRPPLGLPGPERSR